MIFRIDSLSIAILASSTAGLWEAEGLKKLPGSRSASRFKAETSTGVQTLITFRQSVITMPKPVIMIPKSLITIPKRPLITIPKCVITIPKPVITMVRYAHKES